MPRRPRRKVFGPGGALPALLGALVLAAALAPAPAGAQRAPDFDRLLRQFDTDRDARIERSEWRGPLSQFDALDVDHNHVLTRQDIDKVRVAQRAGVPGIADIIDVDTRIHALPAAAGEALDIDYDAAADAAITMMDANRVAISIVMVPPIAQPGMFDDAALFAQSSRHPGRFVVLGGGGTLNPMIQTTPPDKVTPEVRQQFEAEAESILADGAAGFGAIAALRFSQRAGEPFETAPPDHPLLLLLADVAARHHVPIDLDMDIVAEDMPVPAKLREMSPENPETVTANLAAFERLLDHNRDARIVLAHSADATGERTAARIRALIESHPNLYMSLNVPPDFPLQDNLPLKPLGPAAPEWLKLIEDHPDRFMIGSNQLFAAPCKGCKTSNSLTPSLRWLRFLPPAVARQLAHDTPRKVYNLVAG